MILHPSSQIEIHREPFPHLVVQDALEPALAAQLTSSFPPLDVFTGGHRFPDCTKRHYAGDRALKDDSIAPEMRLFMAEHLSPALLTRLLELFAEPLAAQYPRLERDFGPADGWRVGIRYRDDFQHCDTLLDCQLSLHTPVYATTPAADRGPHIKMTDKLFVGHLFLRQPGDQSSGAGLEMFSPQPEARLRFGRDNVTDRSRLRLYKTIPYATNTLVFWLNSPLALQGFAPRTASDVPMTYVNFFAGLPRALFELPRTPATRLRNLAGRLRYRFTRPRQQIDRFEVLGH